MPAFDLSTDPRAPAGAPERFPWRRDLLASLVVFMVALPLCIAIAEASGLPPEAGIITGIVGGVVVGVLSGSPLQVSGPAAGLIVLVLEFMQSREHLLDSGSTGVAPAVALSAALVLAGLLQLLGGVLRLGRWFRAVSPAVVLGMLAGIGIAGLGISPLMRTNSATSGS